MTPIADLMRRDREIRLHVAYADWLLRRDAVDSTLYHVIDVVPVVPGMNLDRFVGQSFIVGTNHDLFRTPALRAVQKSLNRWSQP